MSAASSTVLLTTAKEVVTVLRKTSKSTCFRLQNVALATDSRSVFLATTRVPHHRRLRNVPAGVPGGCFRARYLHPVVGSCSSSPGPEPPAAGVQSWGTHLPPPLQWPSPTPRLGPAALLCGGGGAETNSSVLCLLNTLHLSCCCPATDRPRRSRDEAQPRRRKQRSLGC